MTKYVVKLGNMTNVIDGTREDAEKLLEDMIEDIKNNDDYVVNREVNIRIYSKATGMSRKIKSKILGIR